MSKLHEVIATIESMERDVERVQKMKERAAGAAGQPDPVLMDDSRMLSMVGKQLMWATHIWRTKTPEQQADIFYQSYHMILVKEDMYKQNIMYLKEKIKELEDDNAEQDHMKKKTLALLAKNQALKAQVQKLE